MSSLITNLSNTGETTNVSSTSGTGISQIKNSAQLSTPVAPITIGNKSNFATNQSAGIANADKPLVVNGTVVDGTPYTINLSTGTDQYGNTIGMVHMGRLHVAHTGNTGLLVIGGGTHPVMGSDQVTLQPGGSTVINNAGVGYQVASGAITGVSPVEACPFNDSTGSGTFNLSAMGITTGAITYSATVATLVANINAAFNTSFGSGNIVASGSTLAGIIFTGSANNYQYNPFGGHFTSALITGSTGYTINGSSSTGTTTTTTAGLAPTSGEQDTLTLTAKGGLIPFSLIVLGRSA